MSLLIRSIELDNFRKFRTPVTIDGFTDGLNVVVEPNETGKSTVLEALRAAFFIRHSANTELTRSYCPVGDNVAPRVSVDFDLRGGQWRVTKRFLKSAMVELAGPSGRVQSDDAEDRLQELLGFERGNNRGTDPDTRGALGLLWVEQASALSVEAPGRLVRDTVRSALEGEVGSILGGRKYESVKAQVSRACGELHTATGRATGKLATAAAKAAEASNRRADAERLVSAFERSLEELEAAKKRKALLEREIADPGEQEVRQKLAADLEVAKHARERLATKRAELTALEGEVEKLTDLRTRWSAAAAAVTSAEESLSDINKQLSDLAAEREAAIHQEKADREALALSRERRAEVSKSLQQRQAYAAQVEQSAVHDQAMLRLEQLRQLEARKAELELAAASGIDADEIIRLENLDRKVSETKAVLNAGAIKLEVEVHDDTSLTLNGVSVDPGHWEVTKPIELGVGSHATVRVKPSIAGAASAEAALETALDAFRQALRDVGVEDLAAAKARASQAIAAEQETKGIDAQIRTLCVADSRIGLEAGAAALKSLPPKALQSEGSVAPTDSRNIAEIEADVAEATLIESQHEGRHGASADALRTAEARYQPLLVAQAKAATDLANAQTQHQALEGGLGHEEVEKQLAAALQDLARKEGEVSQAEANASAFNNEAIERRLANIDQAQRMAVDQLNSLANTIARLEGGIEADGGKGLESALAHAREEEAEANSALRRLEREGAVLKFLDACLRQAQEETSRTFLGPVSRRAAKHIHRILPGCELNFSEELGLSAVTRGGVQEGCSNLSRGTQEQLAVLTRLAFADMLLDQGSPVSLILDDPLVYSDDARLDAMTEILAETADRMQVILLTCRERAFRHLGGNRIAL